MNTINIKKYYNCYKVFNLPFFISSSYNSLYPPPNAFDGNTDTYWEASDSSVANYIGCRTEEANIIRLEVYNSYCKNCRFEGSEDGITWVKIPATKWEDGATSYIIDEITLAQTLPIISKQIIYFENNIEEYRFHRLYIYDRYDAQAISLLDLGFFDETNIDVTKIVKVVSDLYDPSVIKLFNQDGYGIIDIEEVIAVVPSFEKVKKEEMGIYYYDVGKLEKNKEYRISWRIEEEGIITIWTEDFYLIFEGSSRYEIRNRIRQLLGEFETENIEIVNNIQYNVIDGSFYKNKQLNINIQTAIDKVRQEYSYLYTLEEDTDEIKEFVEKVTKQYILRSDGDILPLEDTLIEPIIYYAVYNAKQRMDLNEANTFLQLYGEKIRNARLYIDRVLNRTETPRGEII